MKEIDGVFTALIEGQSELGGCAADWYLQLIDRSTEPALPNENIQITRGRIEDCDRLTSSLHRNAEYFLGDLEKSALKEIYEDVISQVSECVMAHAIDMHNRQRESVVNQ